MSSFRLLTSTLALSLTACGGDDSDSFSPFESGSMMSATSTTSPQETSTGTSIGTGTSGASEDTGTSTGTSADGTLSSTSGESTDTEAGTTSGTTGSGSESSSSSTGAAIGGNLFVNPSLETWTSAELPNTTPDAWVDCSVAGLAVDAVPDSCDAQPAAASDGLRYARGVVGEGFEQTVETASGETYAITFDYCGVSGCFGGAPLSSWEVVVDGVSIDSTPSANGAVWSEHAVEFVAAGLTTSICFRMVGGGGQGGIDDLSVALSR